MGVETGKESYSTGPIRRFPTGYWATFNLWWHGEYARQGQRPNSKAIGKWHAENAFKVWGEHAVSYAETQRHANRMKCRRTGNHVQRHANIDEDDDEDDYSQACQDAGPADATECGGGPGASADGNGPPADPPGPLDCRKHEPHAERPLGPSTHRVNFGACSDPPGALRGYMNADSDVPAPAAPSVDVARCSGATKPVWLQPDPPMSPGAVVGPAGQGPEGGPWSRLSWHSAPQMMDLGCVGAGCGASGRTLSCSLGDGSRVVKRSRDEGIEPTREAGAKPPAREHPALGHPGPQAPPPPPPPRSNPFAEVAAAAAAAAGLPAVRAVPAARDAAALLEGAAISSAHRTSSQRHDSPWPEPAWLRPVGEELDALMREVGLLARGARSNAGALPGVMGRPRVLCSVEPLALPDPSPRRDLDVLLRRKLQSAGGVARDRPGAAAAIGGGVGAAVWGREAQPCGYRSLRAGLADVAQGGLAAHGTAGPAGDSMPRLRPPDGFPVAMLLQN